MRRSLLATAAAALLLTAGAPATATAEPHRLHGRAVDVEVLRLECRARVADPEPGAVVHCEWSAPTAPPAAGVKLYRLNPGVDRYRQVVYRSGELSTTEFTDTRVRRGQRYAYAVVAVNEAGRVVARSRPDWVEVPPLDDTDVEVLRLDCGLGPAGEAVGCEWSRPTTRDAAVVSLWRSVDGGARELVERFRPTGPSVHRDPVPKGAEHVAYAVVGTSESGEIVARSRAELVRLPGSHDRPTVDTRPTDTRPVDTRPHDTRPTDTRPTDTRPTDTRPTDTRPTDTRPTDTRPTDTRPTDTRPVDTRPVDTRPVDTRPADTRPRDTRPVDMAPAEPAAGDAARGERREP